MLWRTEIEIVPCLCKMAFSSFFHGFFTERRPRALLSKHMNSDLRKILIGVAQFFLCALLCAGAVGLYYLNLKVDVCVENLIELGQEAFLLGGALLMIRTAMQEKALSGGLWLVGGFLMTLFIRELDAWFDLIRHGCWVYVVIIWLCAIAYIVKQAGLNTVIPGLAHFISHKAYPLMCAGVACLLVYCRLYGMKALWALYSDSSCGSFYEVKSLSEESTELLAYMMIFFSAVFYAYDLMKKRVK